MTESQNRPFVLGLDLDGVCGDYISELRKVLAQKRDVPEESLPLEISWNFPEWELTLDQYKKLHEDAVFEHKIFLNMPAIKGASKSLWELSNQGVWIRIITHRLIVSGGHQTAAQDTAAWLDKNRIPYRELCFVEQKTTVGADVYIDDSPNNVDALRKSGKNVIVFEQHYNREMEGPRAKNWNEAKTLIKEIALKEKGRLASPLPGIDTEDIQLHKK